MYLELLSLIFTQLVSRLLIVGHVCYMDYILALLCCLLTFFLATWNVGS